MADQDTQQQSGGITWHGKKPSPDHPPGGAPDSQALPQAPRDTPAQPQQPDASGITWHGRGGTAAPTQQAPAQLSAQPAPATQQRRAQLPPVLQGLQPPIQRGDPAAAVAHGAIGVPLEAGRMINQWGAKPLGWDLSKLVPPSMQRGYERLTQEANTGGGSQIGETIGSALPFMALGPLEGLPWAGRALLRSVIPSALQPTTGPIDPTTKGLQTLLGTGVGESLHGLSRAAATPLGNWAQRQARTIAEDTRAARDYLQRIMRGRTSQLNETAARTAARDATEQARQRAFSAAQADYQKQVQAAADAEKLNQQRQSVVGRINQRNQLDYAAAQAQLAAHEATRLDTPRQATQSLLNDARGLIGLRPLEYNLTRESAPQVLREVGGELDRIYGQMSFDPNQGGWLANAQRVQRDIANRLRQDPRAQALWQEVFQDKAFMPGLRAEAGQIPGWDIMPPGGPRGQKPRIMREPGERGPSLPMGQRSGPVEGDQLGRMMSVLTKAQQKFGLEAQRGGGGVYRDMAEGLAKMRQSVEAQLDARFPALAEQRRLANQAYFLTSRVMDKVDVHGVATPEGLLQAFKDAEGDTRFGTDKRYADIKDRLEELHKQYTIPPDKPTPPTPVTDPGVPVPKVGKEPTPPAPVPPIKPVPLRVPPSTRTPPARTTAGEGVSPGAARLASEAAGHLAGQTGIPGARRGVGALTHYVLGKYGAPAGKAALRGTRDVSRALATPAAIGTSQGVAGVAGQIQQERERARQRREERQRRQRSE